MVRACGWESDGLFFDPRRMQTDCRRCHRAIQGVQLLGEGCQSRDRSHASGILVIGWVLDVVRACCGVMLAIEHDHDGRAKGLALRCAARSRARRSAPLPVGGNGQWVGWGAGGYRCWGIPRRGRTFCEFKPESVLKFHRKRRKCWFSRDRTWPPGFEG